MSLLFSWLRIKGEKKVTPTNILYIFFSKQQSTTKGQAVPGKEESTGGLVLFKKKEFLEQNFSSYNPDSHPSFPHHSCCLG